LASLLESSNLSENDERLCGEPVLLVVYRFQIDC
jgi:hypothetical protein